MKAFTSFAVLAICLLNQGLIARPLSPDDSVLFYLRQVKGLQKADSVLLENALENIYKIPSDSIPVQRIESALKALVPAIGRRNYLAIKVGTCLVLAYGKYNPKAVDYCSALIDELKNYSCSFEKNLLVYTLAESRFPFRNSNRINEGVDKYQWYANYFVQSGDSTPASVCYSVLAGFYRVLGLLDKAIYCEMKSAVYLDRNKLVIGSDYLIPKYSRVGTIGYIDRYAVLGALLIDNDEPLKAFPYLFTAKSIYEPIKATVDVSSGAFIYMHLIRAKIETGGDSIDHYFGILKSILDKFNEPTFLANYWQLKGYYCYRLNQLDSAQQFLLKSEEIKSTHNVMVNSFAGILIPGYYHALIKIRTQKYPDAIRLLDRESRDLLKINLRRIALREWSLLADVYKQSGDYRNSAETWEKFNTLQKQIITDENRSRSLSFETEQQISLLNAERQENLQQIGRQKLVRNWMIGGISAMFLFSLIFLFQRIRIAREKNRSDNLLLNILPEPVALELKTTGSCKAQTFSMVTVMFMDFKDFTAVSEKVSAELLVDEINTCFSAFDMIIQKYKVEKIKTVGDAYICAGGLPVLNQTHAKDILAAALEIQNFMISRKKEKAEKEEFAFEMRIGIHTGPVVAGIVGVKKFQYDIWGDTVNLAARMEQNSEAGRINISGSTYKLVKDKYECTFRGRIEAKNKGEVEMYFVEA